MSGGVVNCALTVVMLGVASACVSSAPTHDGEPLDSSARPANADAPLQMGAPGLPLKSLIEQVNRCGARQLAIIDPTLEDLRLGGAVCGCDVENIALALQRLGLPVVETTRAPLVHRRARE